MAVADAKYRFLSVSVGSPGSISDGGIFNLTRLSSAIEGKYAGLPDPDVLVGDDVPIPYHIISDDAFAMKTWLMKAFSQRNLKKKMQVFNYRLSRARKAIEHAFGILGARFRCLLATLEMDVKRVESIVFGCCTLH